MDIEQFRNQLLDELKDLSQEKQLNHIKIRIASIPDEKDRQLAETFLSFGIFLSAPKLVVALIHGIRTYATWQELVRHRLDQCGSTTTYSIGYGYLDAFRFWCPFTRKTPIERILKELRGIQMKHRNDKVCVIAHSFGTYIVSKILLQHPDVQLDRLLFCGSVIPENFGWDNIANFPSGGVVNDCGSKDIWPVLAKCASWGYGASGTFGFKTYKVRDRYHDFGHSDFFDKDFIERFWLPFLLEAKIENSIWETKLLPPPLLLSLLNWLPVKKLIILVPVCILLYIKYPLWYSYLEHLL